MPTQRRLATGWDPPLAHTYANRSVNATSTAANFTFTSTALYPRINTTWSTWASNTIVVTSPTTIATTWDAWSNEDCFRIQPRQVFETPEQIAARAAAEEHARTERAIFNARREAAIVRADSLLESILSDVQRAHVRALGYFIVRGPSGALYRIRRGWSGNVDVLSPAGEVLQSLCAHPAIQCPIGDNMAAQKLMLESADEALFLRIANPHGRPATPQRVPSEVLQAMA